VIRLVRGTPAEVLAAPASLGCEAILRPVAADLTAVSAWGREIDRRGGPSLARFLETLGELRPGSAVLSPAGGIEVPFLIHAVIQSVDEAPSPAILRSALHQALRRAMEWEIRTLLLPPLGTGAGALDAEEAVALLLEVLAEHRAAAAFPEGVLVAPGTEWEAELLARHGAVYGAVLAPGEGG
jgi:O-acetyl-ADP-ribose deacetylase (regulator of RNase III)